MVKLSNDLIIKLCSNHHNKRKADETTNQYLSRITHLYLQDKLIEDFDQIIPLKNLTVVYLYDNQLKEIGNLSFALHVKHLYLQNNRIERIENLNGLKKLSKLFLGGNQIRIVEGLDQLTELTELHLENQKLPEGEKLLFEPRTLFALSMKIEILNVSGNNLDTLREIGCLARLQQLFASNNVLHSMKEINIMLKSWSFLWKLDLSNNPVANKMKYRERVIVLAPNLEVLDGKEINDLSRQFLKNWKATKENMQSSKQIFQEI